MKGQVVYSNEALKALVNLMNKPHPSLVRCLINDLNVYTDASVKELQTNGELVVSKNLVYTYLYERRLISVMYDGTEVCTETAIYFLKEEAKELLFETLCQYKAECGA